MVRRKLEEIRECWQDLESTTQAKARQLFEANKADLLVQSYESLDQRLGQLEGQLAYVDQGQDLTTVNKQLKKLHVRRIKKTQTTRNPVVCMSRVLIRSATEAFDLFRSCFHLIHYQRRSQSLKLSI